MTRSDRACVDDADGAGCVMTVVGLKPHLGPCCTPTTRRDLSHLEPKITAAAVRTRSMTDLRKVTKDRGSRAQVGVADGGLTSWSKTPHESASSQAWRSMDVTEHKPPACSDGEEPPRVLILDGPATMHHGRDTAHIL